MDGNNIIPAIIAIFPTFFYSMGIYFMIPKNMVSWRRMRKYFGIGLASPLIVFFIHYIFPGILSPSAYGLTGSLFVAVFLAAGLEEFAKYSTFKFTNHTRRSSKDDYPIAIMIYSMSAAAAFAIVENFIYAMQWGSEVLLIRGVSANVMHLICGLIIGYFIAKAKMVSKPLFKTEKEKLKNWLILSKKFLIIFFGLLVSTVYHSLYNTNLYLADGAGLSYVETTFCIFILGIFITYYMARELVIKSKKIKLDKYGKL